MTTRKPTLVIHHLLIEGDDLQALAYQARIAADRVGGIQASWGA